MKPRERGLLHETTWTKTDPVKAIRDLLPGGADHVFDFVGQKSVAEQGLAMLGVGGGLYLVGVATPDVESRGEHL